MPFDLFDPTTLHRIKSRAESIIRSGEELEPHNAYLSALVYVVMQAAEEQAMNPFEARIVQTVERLQRENGSRPVSTVMISIALSNHREPMNRFTLAHHLSKLEARGLLCRPNGLKSGWAKAA